MYSWLITFSLRGKHRDELREALHLEHVDVPDVLDLSGTLIHLRQNIIPQPNLATTKKEGAVLVISDYPQTGKSCLAFTLANDWLSIDQGSSQEQHQVLIISPLTSRDCSVEQLTAALQALPKMQQGPITTLVIIDDLESCLIRAEDPQGLLAWLFRSDARYHKLLIFTEGVIFHKQRQALFLEHIEQVKKHMEDGKPYFVGNMEYFMPDTLNIMARAFSYRRIGYCSLLAENSVESQLQNALDALTIQRKDGSNSYVIGFAHDILNTTAWPLVHANNQNSTPSRALQRFKKKAFVYEENGQNIYIILKILMILHMYYKLPLSAGCSLELVNRLFALYNQGSSQAQFDVALDSLITSSLLIESQEILIAPVIWLKVLFIEGADSSSITAVFDAYLKTITAQLIRPQSWLQIGLICLAQKNIADAVDAFARCIETPVEQEAIEYLADSIISLVNPLLLEDSTNHFSLAKGLIENFVQQLKKIFKQEDFTTSSTSSPQNRLLQHLIDMLIAKTWCQAMQRGVSLWNSLDEWQPLLDLGSSTTSSGLATMALDQLLLFNTDSTDLAQFITHIFSLLVAGSKERQVPSVSALAILRLISPLTHSAHDTRIVIKRLYDASFTNKRPPSLTDSIHSDFWQQTVQAALYFLKLYAEDSERDDFLFWIKSLMDVLVSVFNDPTQRSIVLICWSRDILAQSESNYHTFFVLLNDYVNDPKLFFQVCLALLSSCDLSSAYEEQKIKSILEQSVEMLDHLDALNTDFQLYLSFFLISLDFIQKQNGVAQGVEKLIEECKISVDEKLIPYRAKFYVIDEIQWGTNYKALLTRDFHLPFVKLTSQNWPEKMCSTYVVGLHFLHNLHQEKKVQTFLHEARTFCQTFSIIQQWQSPIDVFVKLQKSALPQENVSSSLEAEVSRSYTIDATSMHFVQELLNAKSEKEADIIHANLLLHLSKYPNNSGTWFILGDFMQKRRDDLNAIYYYKIAQYLAPNVLDSPLRIAQIYHKLKKTKQEIEILKQADSENRSDIVCLMLARAYKDLRQNKEAIYYYRRALALNTDEQYSALQELAETLQHEQEITQAVSVYWNMLRLNFVSTNIVMQILLLLEDLDEYSQLSYLGANISFQDVAEALLSYLAEHFGATAWLAAPYFYIGDREKAWSALMPPIDSQNSSQTQSQPISYSVIAATMEEGKYNHEANFYRALHYLDVYQYEEAVENLCNYLNEFPKDEEAHYYLAYSYKGLVEVKDTLNLLSAEFKVQSDLAFKEGLLALFLGMEKHLIYGLLGEICSLKGRKNSYFYTFSLLYLEQAYLMQPIVSTVARIAQIRLESIILETPTLSNEEQREKLLERLQKEVIYWLNAHLHDTLHASIKATINNTLGTCYLRTIQEISRFIEEKPLDHMLQECEQLLLNGESALQASIEAKNEDFTTYLHLGKLYWEWQTWVSAPEDRIEKINRAIEAWERSQKLTRDVQIHRIQRSVREEMEILIASAMKQLKVLVKEE